MFTTDLENKEERRLIDSNQNLNKILGRDWLSPTRLEH